MNKKTIDKILVHNIISSNENIRQSIVRKIKSKYLNTWNYIVNRYVDSESIPETIYRMYFGIEKRPICKICGNKVSYMGKGKYRNVCSFKCGEMFSRERRQKKMMDLYGTTIPLRNNDIKERMKSTLISKYGVDNPSNIEFVKQRKVNTFLSHYGVDNYFKTIESVKNSHTRECIEKQINTKRINNTFNSSKLEDKTYNLLVEKYEEVIRQYKDTRYPFMCDFYVPKLDLFIECNYHWTHGGHPYNDKNIEDQEKLNKWKLRNTKYYDNAIHTWTKRDVNKRKIAKENNLNYIEIYNINELY